MLRKLLGTFGLFAALFALVIAPAQAAVTYFPDTGGYVGKGDVQTLFGWNNATLQLNAESLLFTYESKARYSQICSKEVEVGKDRELKIVDQEFKRGVEVNATVQYDVKKQNQVSGFSLARVDLSSATVPSSLCPNDNSGFEPKDKDGNPTEPVLISSEVGGLKVNGVSLPNTPAI